jgi:hypothetical protein
MTKISPYFCVAPWTHTYVSPQGERRLCCASREKPSFQKQYIDQGSDNDSDFSPVSLDEHWNSEYMKEVRRRILAGEKIPQCDVCNNQILNLHTYKDYFTKTLFPNKLEQIIKSTDQDGATTLKPVSYDYRISNLCNFKCRMCGDQLSSSWEAERIMYQKIDHKKDKWLYPPTRKEITKFQVEVLEEELQAAVDSGSIEEIYWVGGEPLMWERHWSIMQQLVDTGKSKEVVIRYNTNLSRISYKNYRLYDLLPHFKKVNICASIDGVGIIGEYIRTGLDWNNWLKNFKEGMFLIEKFGDDAIVFDVTLTTPGLFDLKNLFDVVNDLGVKSYVKITFAFDPTIIMSPLCLPRCILEPAVRDVLSYIQPRVNVKTKVYEDTLLNLLDRQNFEEQWPHSFSEGLKKGKRQIEFLESIRTQSITFEQILPDYAKGWWKSI